MAQRYGLDKTADADDMLRALEEDDSMFEECAMAKGMSTEQYREFYRLEKQNEEFRRAAEGTQRIRQADETYSKWMSEADALKEIYPNFSFDEEVENKDFLQLLQNGIDVRTAYEVAHHEEIMRGAMQMASAKTAERVTDGIRAKGLRPAENGTNTSSKPVEQKIDISKLTAKDIDELSKRAARGEKNYILTDVQNGGKQNEQSKKIGKTNVFTDVCREFKSKYNRRLGNDCRDERVL